MLVDGNVIEWIKYSPKSDTVSIIGNTDNMNIWLHETRPDMTTDKYNQLLKAFAKIKEDMDLDFSFDYYMEGDTYGIYDEGCYISFLVNGYEFKFSQ